MSEIEHGDGSTRHRPMPSTFHDVPCGARRQNNLMAASSPAGTFSTHLARCRLLCCQRAKHATHCGRNEKKTPQHRVRGWLAVACHRRHSVVSLSVFVPPFRGFVRCVFANATHPSFPHCAVRVHEHINLNRGSQRLLILSETVCCL